MCSAWDWHTVYMRCQRSCCCCCNSLSHCCWWRGCDHRSRAMHRTRPALSLPLLQQHHSSLALAVVTGAAAAAAAVVVAARSNDCYQRCSFRAVRSCRSVLASSLTSSELVRKQHQQPASVASTRVHVSRLLLLLHQAPRHAPHLHPRLTFDESSCIRQGEAALESHQQSRAS